MNTRLAIALIALTLPILSACGNKGPLVKPSEPVLTEVTTTPDPAASDDATPQDATSAPQTAPPVQIVPAPPQTPPADDGDGSG